MPFTSETARAAGKKPKKRDFITQQIIAELNKVQPDEPTKAHRFVLKLIDRAIIDGEITAFKEILDRVEGRVPQEQQIDGTLGITIGIVRYTDSAQLEAPPVSNGLLEGPGEREEAVN